MVEQGSHSGVEQAQRAALDATALPANTRGPIGRALSKLAYHPAGPTVLAVAFAMISLPFVAFTLNAYELMDAFQISDIRPLSPTDPARWTAAGSAVLLSGVIAGVVGGWLIRHRRGHSYWVALLVAWICGIGGTTLLPSLLGQHFGAAPMCIDSCGYSITTDQPGWNFAAAALFFWLGPIYEYEALGVLVVGFVAWSQILIRFGPQAPPPEVPRWGYPWPQAAPATSVTSAPVPVPITTAISELRRRPRVDRAIPDAGRRSARDQRRHL